MRSIEVDVRRNPASPGGSNDSNKTANAHQIILPSTQHHPVLFRSFVEFWVLRAFCATFKEKQEIPAGKTTEYDRDQFSATIATTGLELEARHPFFTIGMGKQRSE